MNIRVADKDAVINDSEVQKEKLLVEETLGEDGRVLLRKSGTEPVVRVMVEANDEKLCRASADRIAEVIKGSTA